MRKTWTLSIVVVLPLLALGLVLGVCARAPAQAAPPYRPHHQAPGDRVVTSTAHRSQGLGR